LISDLVISNRLLISSSFNTFAAFFRMVLGLVSLKTCRFWGISTSDFSDKSPFPRGQVFGLDTVDKLRNEIRSSPHFHEDKIIMKNIPSLISS